MKISLQLTGFTKDASYSIPIYDCVKSYENKFPEIEEVIVNCKELLYSQLGNKRPPLFELLDDGKKMIINIPQGQYYDSPRNGKLPKAYNRPSVESVCRDLVFAFDKIIENRNN